MFALQLAELSHMISTFGSSFCCGVRPKMSMSSAAAIEATPRRAVHAARRIVRLSGFMEFLLRPLLAERRRVRGPDWEGDALVDSYGGIRDGVVDCGGDVPLAVRAERVARRDRLTRPFDEAAAAAPPHA